MAAEKPAPAPAAAPIISQEHQQEVPIRDDLLEAQAAVDWAISQLDTLEGRIETWKNDRPCSISYDPHPEMRKKLIRFHAVKETPPLINAEAGAIINSIRSSLDVLINKLAARNGHADPKDTQFPISANRRAFLHGKHAGRKEIKRLSDADRAVIESLEPWRGGNHLLVALHDLDNTRKHRRLIGARPLPETLVVTPEMVREGFAFVSVWPGLKNEAIIATTGIDAPDRNIYLTLTVTLAEAGLLTGKPIIEALREFASLADSIIKLFDT